ncbi:MAG: hypothetical protein L0215_14135 [Gemmataceae bacterium]|nr:hypothetical protein [Gemmataceae bacterium]
MKVKTALTQSKAQMGCLSVALVPLLVWLFHSPGPASGIVTGLVAVCLLMEIITIITITRQARKDPSYLEEKIQ